MTIYIDI